MKKCLLFLESSFETQCIVTFANVLTRLATCKVFVEALVKSESGDLADVCLCGGFGNHSILVRGRMTS